MSIEKKQVTIEISYYVGESEPENGIYRGGVVEPVHLGELALWTHPTALEEEVETSDLQEEVTVHLGGSARALAELGTYLVAVSMYQTEDPHYHDHLEELAEVPGRAKCVLIVHGPKR